MREVLPRMNLERDAIAIIAAGIDLALEGIGHVEQNTGQASLPEIRDVLQRTQNAVVALAEFRGVKIEKLDL